MRHVMTRPVAVGSLAGVGFSWGNGVLTYKGKTYPVQVEGLSVGEMGVTRATAMMRNQNGVVIELQSTTQGAREVDLVNCGSKP
jgi:hypothetical protein